MGHPSATLPDSVVKTEILTGGTKYFRHACRKDTIVDGKTQPQVGVHFRGMSSYKMVPAGYKRSLNVSLDLVDPQQRLYGYKTLNLLNAHEDDSFLSSILYSQIARQYMPAPQANLVNVVINGESWGVYVNVQQFDKVFVKEHYASSNGTRWKVSGSPMGGGGLDYLGDEITPYRRHYEIKSKDDDEAWTRLIALCRTLDETPAEKLASVLAPMLDIDELLWFLALDTTLINCDGYWIRASDYSIFLDDKNVFHVLPHDMNEAFRPPMGPGMGGPGGARGRRSFGSRSDRPAEQGGPIAKVNLDPLVGLDDPRKPLRGKVLAVPELRERYLHHVRTIAEKSLDWNTLGPLVAQYRELARDEIELDTRKLTSYDDFLRATSDELATELATAQIDTTQSSEHEPPRMRPTMSLREFSTKRREYLLSLPSIVEITR